MTATETASAAPRLSEDTSSAELGAALEALAALAPLGEAPILLSVSRPTMSLDPISAYEAARPLGAALWLRPNERSWVVGIGQAWSAPQRPGPRFALVSAAWRALLRDARLDVTAAARGAGPLLIGGFAFDARPARTEPWRAFPPAGLVLPGLSLTAGPDGSWVTASMVVTAGGPAPAVMVEALQQTWAQLAATARSADAAPSAVPLPTSAGLRIVEREPEAAAWIDSVARLAGAVGRGRLDKAVLSRRVTLQAAQAIDPAAVMRRLAASASGSTLFAISRGQATFLGATPERLVSLRGRELRTMAVAGTTRRSVDEAEDDHRASELLASDKEREEHAVVVDWLRDALTPLTDRLDVPAVPEVVRLRHVQHLVTPVSGRLRASADVLSVVERLHPTPAVGGAPRDLALELIADEEPHERGWYAGPLGWIDRHGDGEFVVALRSGVVAGSTATLYAGCGIVADSDPEREWDESSAKLMTLGSALGSIEP
jgi:isochorismate synthase